MKNVGYYNGEIGEIEKMMVPMNDRAMYFGDGVYDATYAANRKIFEADAHIERFFNSFKALEMPFKMTREELKTLTETFGNDLYAIVNTTPVRGFMSLSLKFVL